MQKGRKIKKNTKAIECDAILICGSSYSEPVGMFTKNFDNRFLNWSADFEKLKREWNLEGSKLSLDSFLVLFVSDFRL